MVRPCSSKIFQKAAVRGVEVAVRSNSTAAIKKLYLKSSQDQLKLQLESGDD